MKDATARILTSVLFLALFVAIPSVLAVVGEAAIGGTGGASPPLNFYNVSMNGDAGTSTNSIEFVTGDCTGFTTNTHASGWSTGNSTIWGSFGGPYAQFFDAGNVYLGDCSTTRPGQYVIQPGRGGTTAANRVGALSSNFTMYVKYTQSSPVVATDGMMGATLYAFGTGAPSDFLACGYGTVNAGLSNVAQGSARVGGVITGFAAVDLPLDTVRPRIVLMQKNGTTGSCWYGAEDGNFVFGGSGTVGASTGSVSQTLSVANGVGAFGVGTPYVMLDYIRIVDGVGDYFP